MATKVAKRAASLEHAESLVEQVAAALGPVLALTAKERKFGIKLPKGGVKIIRTVAALSDQAGVNVPAYPTATMTADAAEAESLIAIHSQLISATKQVADQIFSANRRSWKAATTHYVILRRLARNDGDLQAKLAEAQEFFKRRKKVAAKPDPAKTPIAAEAAGAAPASPTEAPRLLANAAPANTPHP